MGCTSAIILMLSSVTSLLALATVSSYPKDFKRHTSPLIDWEPGLKEATRQVLLRNRNLSKSIRDKLLTAPIVGKENRALPFGDIAVLARGQLFAVPEGFRFVQDPYQNDCVDCHARRFCKQNDCGVYKTHASEKLLALWSVKRIRHRSGDLGHRYELEYTISPTQNAYLNQFGGFDYNIPGHVFIVKTNNNRPDFVKIYHDEHFVSNSGQWNNRKYLPVGLPPPPVEDYYLPIPSTEGTAFHPLRPSGGNRPNYQYLPQRPTQTYFGVPTAAGTKFPPGNKNDIYKKLLESLAQKTSSVPTKSIPHRFGPPTKTTNQFHGQTSSSSTTHYPPSTIAHVPSVVQQIPTPQIPTSFMHPQTTILLPTSFEPTARQTTRLTSPTQQTTHSIPILTTVETAPYLTTVQTTPYGIIKQTTPYVTTKQTTPYTTTKQTTPYLTTKQTTPYLTTKQTTPYLTTKQTTPYITTKQTIAHVTTKQTTPYVTTKQTTPYVTTKPSIPYKTTKETIPYSTTKQTTPYITTKQTIAHVTTIQTTPYVTTKQSIPYKTTKQTIPYSTTKQTTPYITTKQTIAHVTTKQTTPYITTKQTTPYVTTKQTTPYVTTKQTTPYTTTKQTTPYSTTKQITPYVTMKQTTPYATTKQTTPHVTTKQSTPYITTKHTTTHVTTKQTTPRLTTKQTTYVTSKQTTPYVTSKQTTPFVTTKQTTPYTTTKQITPLATTKQTTPLATTKKTTPLATTKKTTPLATTKQTSPLATTKQTTPLATTKKTTPLATTKQTTPLATTKTTPYTSKQTTPKITTPKATIPYAPTQETTPYIPTAETTPYITIKQTTPYITTQTYLTPKETTPPTSKETTPYVIIPFTTDYTTRPFIFTTELTFPPTDSTEPTNSFDASKPIPTFFIDPTHPGYPRTTPITPFTESYNHGTGQTPSTTASTVYQNYTTTLQLPASTDRYFPETTPHVIKIPVRPPKPNTPFVKPNVHELPGEDYSDYELFPEDKNKSVTTTPATTSSTGPSKPTEGFLLHEDEYYPNKMREEELDKAIVLFEKEFTQKPKTDEKEMDIAPTSNKEYDDVFNKGTTGQPSDEEDDGDLFGTQPFQIIPTAASFENTRNDAKIIYSGFFEPSTTPAMTSETEIIETTTVRPAKPKRKNNAPTETDLNETTTVRPAKPKRKNNALTETDPIETTTVRPAKPKRKNNAPTETDLNERTTVRPAKPKRKNNASTETDLIETITVTPAKPKRKKNTPTETDLVETTTVTSTKPKRKKHAPTETTKRKKNAPTEATNQIDEISTKQSFSTSVSYKVNKYKRRRAPTRLPVKSKTKTTVRSETKYTPKHIDSKQLDDNTSDLTQVESNNPTGVYLSDKNKAVKYKRKSYTGTRKVRKRVEN